MSTTYDNVIIFGPTGGVGSVAALEASKLGAKVWLAMRDPSKPIKTLSGVNEAGSFERIQADLGDVESVKAAINKSGAKSAYIYYVHGPDYKATIKALQDSGIEHLVFLSSFTIQQTDELTNIPQSSIIPFIHAQVEILLDQSTIPSVVALRAGNFASNPLVIQLDKTTRSANLYHAEQYKVDAISPDDIGRVAGNVLVKKPSAKSKEIIYLFGGPKTITTGEQWRIINEITGKSYQINDVDEQGYVDHMKAKHVPPPFIKYMVDYMNTSEEGHYPQGGVAEGHSNIEKYSGRKGATFREYVEAHRDEFP